MPSRSVGLFRTKNLRELIAQSRLCGEVQFNLSRLNRKKIHLGWINSSTRQRKHLIDAETTAMMMIVAANDGKTKCRIVPVETYWKLWKLSRSVYIHKVNLLLLLQSFSRLFLSS